MTTPTLYYDDGFSLPAYCKCGNVDLNEMIDAFKKCYAIMILIQKKNYA